MRSIRKPSPCGTSRTLARVLTEVVAKPALSQAKENAMRETGRMGRAQQFFRVGAAAVVFKSGCRSRRGRR